MRSHFSDLFAVKNGMVSPKVPVMINGIVMTPGVAFGGGVSFGDVNLVSFAGKYLEVEINNGVYVIKGYYPD